MSYYLDCITKFSYLPEEIRNNVGSFESMAVLDDIKKLYNLDLKFELILLAIGELTWGTLPSYLIKKYNLNKDTADKIKDKIKKEIFDNIPAPEKSIEKNPYEVIKSKLKNNLLEMLTEDDDYKEALNEEFIFLLTYNENSPLELSELLYKNSEFLTSKNLIIKNETLRPVAKNWIRDFKESNADVFFNNLILSNYLVKSNNVRILDQKEKKIVKDFLLLYRNIKFFETMIEKLSPDEWEILPLERDDDNTKKRIFGPPKTREEKEIDSLSQAKETVAKSELEKRMIEEEIIGKKKIEDLKIMANKFPAGSLERKAVEEEIARLNQKL